ncbi:probable carboxypeptidase X1 [Patiria miniata]|uniref:F5/8 type C domain-containing protein n=1 Tax=Patiria miniata TaxID=46514 RepID=A0A914AU47_PATMI|nr:probable carboxypeptidase X1 [Patiria miniata]
MESGVIPDSALSTSSVGNPGYGKEMARLNSHAAWCTRGDIDLNAWIRVDLPDSVTVTGLITQGRDYSSTYTTSFSVQYGNGTNWSEVVGKDGSPIVFQANSDCCTPVTVYFPSPLQLRSFRILPVDWVTTSICIRFELLGCGAI